MWPMNGRQGFRFGLGFVEFIPKRSEGSLRAPVKCACLARISDEKVLGIRVALRYKKCRKVTSFVLVWPYAMPSSFLETGS